MMKKNSFLKGFAVVLLGLFAFAGVHAQNAPAKKNKDPKENRVVRGSLTYEQVIEQFPNYPEVVQTDDPKADAAAHRKLVMEWKAEHPEEYKEFVKKMKENTVLSEKGKKEAEAQKKAAESTK